MHELRVHELHALEAHALEAHALECCQSRKSVVNRLFLDCTDPTCGIEVRPSNCGTYALLQAPTTETYSDYLYWRVYKEGLHGGAGGDNNKVYTVSSAAVGVQPHPTWNSRRVGTTT